MRDEVKAVRDLVMKIKPKTIAIEGACAYHALAARMLLGKECMIVAGDASWKFTTVDTGTNPTHFSYIYTPGVYTIHSSMPEMHIWNIYKGKHLDLTTRYWPQQCKKLIGQDFSKELIPPDYHHGEGSDKNVLWRYEPLQEATMLAHAMIKVIINA